MSDDYLWDKSGPPDPDIAKLENVLGTLRHEEPWKEPETHVLADNAGPPANVLPLRSKPQRKRVQRLGAAGAVLAVAAAVLLWFSFFRKPVNPPVTALIKPEPLLLPRIQPTAKAQSLSCAPSVPGFPFESVGQATWGGLSCDGAPVSSGNLPVGAWLATAEGTSATLMVADIGALTLRGGSRIRIVRSGPNEHRLELEKGSFHAVVDAPPKLFVVDTAAATAVDLGCEYEMSTDQQSRTHLQVVKGAVSLESKERSVFVPRRSMVTADPKTGMGTVLSTGASQELRSLVDRFDAGEKDLLDPILKLTARSDSVTLWTLLESVPKSARAKVVERFLAIGVVPRGVSGEALVQGQTRALAALRDSLENDWFATGKGEKGK